MSKQRVMPAPAAEPRLKMPVDRFAMMRQVNQEANASAFDTVSATQNHRERKEQETKRRAEVALMEKEDYTFTQEGVDRLKRREARLLMEAEEKRTRQILSAEAAARYAAAEKERKRIEAEERQRLLEVHRAQMEAQKAAEAADLARKLTEREARLRKMKEDADRKVREEYQKKEAAKRAEINQVRQLQQQQTERELMESEEEAERDRLRKAAEQAAIQERIRAEEMKWKAWEEAEAIKEAEALAARRALLAAQYEEDKVRRMDLHRLRKEKESRLKKMTEPETTVSPVTDPANKGIPKVGSFVVKPAPDTMEWRDVAALSKDQLRDELTTCAQLKKSLKQEIVAWCDSFQAKMHRPPSLEEKQEIQPLYKRYSEVESHFRAVKARLDGDAKLVPVAEAPPVKSSSPTKLPPTNDAPSLQVILTNRKREVKKAIQDWTSAFQAAHGHLPSVQDKKEILSLYEDYAKIDAQLKNFKYTVVSVEAPTPHKKTPKTGALDMNAIKEMAAKQAGLTAKAPANQVERLETKKLVSDDNQPGAGSEDTKAPRESIGDPEAPEPTPSEPVEEPFPSAPRVLDRESNVAETNEPPTAVVPALPSEPEDPKERPVSKEMSVPSASPDLDDNLQTVPIEDATTDAVEAPEDSAETTTSPSLVPEVQPIPEPTPLPNTTSAPVSNVGEPASQIDAMSAPVSDVGEPASQVDAMSAAIENESTSMTSAPVSDVLEPTPQADAMSAPTVDGKVTATAAQQPPHPSAPQPASIVSTVLGDTPPSSTDAPPPSGVATPRSILESKVEASPVESTTEASAVSVDNQVPPPEVTLPEWLALELSVLDALDDASPDAESALEARLDTVVATIQAQTEAAPAFLRVETVEAASPASAANVLPNDLIVRFGTVLRDASQPTSTLIRDVVALVNARAATTRALGISVRRGDAIVHLVLRPQKWAGAGLLGCVLQPYEAPSPPKPRPLSAAPVAPLEDAFDSAPLRRLMPQPVDAMDFQKAVDHEMQLYDAQDALMQWLQAHPSTTADLAAIQAQLEAVLAHVAKVLHGHLRDAGVVPYLRVDTVEAGSPAANSGLLPSDLVIRFGAVVSVDGTKTPASSLIQHIVALVNTRRDHRLSLSVVRSTENDAVHLTIRPQTWAGAGALGCVLHPYERPTLRIVTEPELPSWPPNAFAYIDAMAAAPSPASVAGLLANDCIIGFQGLQSGATLQEALTILTDFPLTLYLSRNCPPDTASAPLGYLEFAVVLHSWDGILSIQPLVAIEARDDPSALPYDATLPSVPFARVLRVYPESPADTGGLMAGDYVHVMSDVAYPSPEAVSDWIGHQFSTQSHVALQIARCLDADDRYTEIQLRILPERWCAPQLHLAAHDRRMIELFGWTLEFLKEPVYPPFLVVESVVPASPAALGGVCAGDLVGKFGSLLKASLGGTSSVAEMVHLYLGPEAKQLEGHKLTPLPMQVHRYDATTCVLTRVNLFLPPPKPGFDSGDGVWGCCLQLWSPEALEPLLVVVAAGTSSGLQEGDLLLDVQGVRAPSSLDAMAAAIASASSLTLVVQRWDPAQYLYIYFPLVVAVGPRGSAIVDCEIDVGGVGCITYTTYWQRYEAANPSALPCKSCWEANFATVAHGAAYCGHLDCLTYLSQYFDVFCVDPLGRTPLFYAAYANQVDCILLLLSIDVDGTLREATDANGDTILHAATSGGALAAMQLLLQHGLSTERVNNLGLRPVHIAPTMEALQVLADGQADLVALDTSGRLALAYACMAGDEACVAYLAAEGSEFIDYADMDGNTPLHFAVLSGSLSVVQALLTAAPHYVLRPNKDGKSALDHAIEHGFAPLAAYLEATCMVPDESGAGLQPALSEAPLQASSSEAID